MALPGAKENLKLFKADLMDPGSFDGAVKGCSIVIHTAAPVLVEQGNLKENMIEPMVKGVDNVLGSVERCTTVRRVVMTSSIAAVGYSVKPVLTEDDWEAEGSDTQLEYAYGKRLSEQRAWELAGKQTRWSLVTVLPSIIFGPVPLTLRSAPSTKFMQQLLTQCWPLVGNLSWPTVDVRDVAAVHTLAAFTPRAHGRYMCSSRNGSMYGATYAIKARFEGFWPASLVAPQWLVLALVPPRQRPYIKSMWGKCPQYDSRRALSDLGLSGWVPLEDSLEDMTLDLAAKGLVKEPPGRVVGDGGVAAAR
ncbi:hypothetical protein CHLRE_12g547800v5 [Chlamydomonas reinhardtii]|uniref:3-beta hydroxysteroid dehydrogenase/isomerase domain-containing protein n=1 Tax=Chlamydomonas reinhardtii TaxID=3055 RepID=A0A2K3D6E2_CHLRE|nr:uncharacterized protein CHLRE_12g547800v5 [Chlamydomonas reinhardtii]PNW76100.1 hypothetical protein CHLRE_12g547800v5 [Chlamydomonas reinhardtii]